MWNTIILHSPVAMIGGGTYIIMTYLADICETFSLVWGELKENSKIEERDNTDTCTDESLDFEMTTP